MRFALPFSGGPARIAGKSGAVAQHTAGGMPSHDGAGDAPARIVHENRSGRTIHFLRRQQDLPAHSFGIEWCSQTIFAHVVPVFYAYA